jgi:ubiquinone/menaquinone biosynthesis C-methylase UbiE
MSEYAEAMNRHYGPIDISARILERLEKAGKDLSKLSRDDFVAFDEFHGGGRESTRELAKAANVRPGMTVLDIGSGVGGPARTLAAEFGCEVVGVELAAEYCRAAEMLTEKVGLAGKVRFRCANALDMPFPNASFDVVWSQNTLMNIDDKARLFREIRRVLRPGGTFAFEAVLAGAVPGVHLPVFWADSPLLNHLATPEEIRRLLAGLGLVEQAWGETTAGATINQKNRREAIRKNGPPLLGLSVIVPNDELKKLDNVIRNNEESRTIRVQAVYAA